MYMVQHQSDESWGSDYRGKTIVVATHIEVERIEQVREDLRSFVANVAENRLRVSGFVLGKIVDVSMHGQYWVSFPWSAIPVHLHPGHVLRILLDDEAEPDTVNGLPRLI